MRIKTLILLAGCFMLTSLFPGDNAWSSTKPVVHFGVSLRFHPITLYERYQPMMDYLTRSTPYRFELKVSRDYKETIRFLEEGEIDVASIGDGGLMKALLLSGAVPVVKPLNAEGKPYYRSCLVVPNDSPIRSLNDLKGKRVALGYHHSTTGNMIPRDMLQKSGIKLSALASVTSLRHHGEVARAVLKGKYDAGFVKESTALRYSEKGLRVVYRSENLPSIPMIARRDAPPGLAAAITAALVGLDRRKPEHRKIVEGWDLEYQQGFVPATAADYRELTSMFMARPFGCGSGCHK